MEIRKYTCDDQAVPRPKTGTTPVRNLRVADDIWDPSLSKAKGEGHTLTAVITEFLRGFARLTVSWAEYVKACEAEGTKPGDDLRRHIQRKVQTWKRKQVDD
jgi:hypothetical protein